jgi:hypothetical protein
LERAVEVDLQEQMAAERTERVADGAVAAAGVTTSGGADGNAGALGSLSVTLLKIEQTFADGKMTDARRIELSEKLKRLAELMEQGGGASKLTDAIKRAGEELAENGPNATALLRAAREELARLERALEDSKFTDAYARQVAERKRAELRAAALASGSDESPATADDTGDEDLVELAAAARRPPDEPSGTGGILYSTDETKPSGAAGWPGYDRSAKMAMEQIESGVVPPRHARLVRGYFDSIRPSGK